MQTFKNTILEQNTLGKLVEFKKFPFLNGFLTRIIVDLTYGICLVIYPLMLKWWETIERQSNGVRLLDIPR